MPSIRSSDFESSIQLAEKLVEFQNGAFPDAGVFSKIDLSLLKRWLQFSRPCFKVIGILNSERDSIHGLADAERNIYQNLLDLFEEPELIKEIEWIDRTVKSLFELVCEGLKNAADASRELLTKRPAMTLADSQGRFMTFRNFCLASDVLIHQEWNLKLSDEINRLIDCLKSFLLVVKDIIQKRFNNALARDNSLSLEQLEMIERDLVSAQLIGRLVPPIDAHAVSIFNDVFHDIIVFSKTYLRELLKTIRPMNDIGRVKLVHEIVKRRYKVLKMIESTTRSLSTKVFFQINDRKDDLKGLLEFLKASNYKIIDGISTASQIFFASPGLVNNESLLLKFLEIGVKRADIFSDDFVLGIPSSFLKKFPEFAWEHLDVDCSGKRLNGSDSMTVVYSYCFTMLEELSIKLVGMGLEPVVKQASNENYCCYAEEHPEDFVDYILDSLNSVNLIPIKQFGVKELADFWKSSINFWDLTDSFRGSIGNLILSDTKHIKYHFCKTALSLLRFSCSNIRMNYLEPFTWATDILERLTNLLAESDEAFIKTCVDPNALTTMYMEFHEKWAEIEKAANKQWEHCLLLKQDVSNLQRGAHKLERTLWHASQFLQGITPLEKVSDNFLLNFPITINMPIFDFIALKNLKLVSLLKRKQWIDTYCCYDLTERKFIVVKEIRLIKNAKQTVERINLLDRYSELFKFKHPYLARYYYAEMHGETLYVALECFGSSLNGFLTENGQIEDEFLFKRFCISILICLAYLHNHGIAHGDIQPGNILQDPKGSFKLVDYGDVNRHFKAELSKVDLSYLSGTVPYMAPEVVLNYNKYDGIKADIWSFGCLLIQLVTGYRPWHELEHDYAIIFRLGATKFLPEALINLPLSPEGSDFVKSCLDHNPDTRPSVDDLLKSSYLSIEIPRPRS